MTDITYFESGYIDNTYFVYTAEDSAHLTCSSSLTSTATVHHTLAVTANLISSSTLSADVSVVSHNKYATATLSSKFSIRAKLDGTTRYIDPWIINGSNYGSISFDPVNTKFGATSLKFGARSSAGAVDLGPVYGSSIFIGLNIPAAITEPSYTYSSTDGVTWVTTTNNLPNPSYNTNTVYTWGILKYLNGKFIIPVWTNTGSRYFYTSTDGINWSRITTTLAISDSNIVTDMTYINGYYVITIGPAIYDSTDLATWSGLKSITVPSTVDGLNAIASYSVGGSLIVAAGYDSAVGPTIAYSHKTIPDALTTDWHTFNAYASGATTVQKAQKFLSAATDGTNWIFVGTSGIIFWTTSSLLNNNLSSNSTMSMSSLSSGTTEDIVQVIYNTGKWIAKTASGKILYSTTATSWTLITPPVTSPTTTTPWVDGTIWINSGLYQNSVTYGSGKWVAGSYYSTNGTTWTSIDFIGQIPNQQPSIYYEPGQYLNQWNTIDFWLYINPTSYKSINNGILFQYDTTTGATLELNFDINNSSTPRLYFYDIDATTGLQEMVFSPVVINTWNHIRIVSDGVNGAMFVNGSRTATFSPFSSLRYINAPMYVGRGYGDERYSRDAYWIDELLLTRQLLSLPSDTTYAIPTGEWSNGPYVDALFHFNNDIDDDNLPWVAAILSSTSTFKALGGKLQTAAAVLTARSTVTATSVKVKPFSATLTARSTLTEISSKTISSSALLSSRFTLVGIDRAIDSDSARLVTTSSMNIQAARIRSGSSTLSSTTSLIANDIKIRNAIAQLAVSSTMTASVLALKVVNNSAFITSSSTISIQSTRVRRAFSALTSRSSIAPVANKVIAATAHLNSHFTVTGRIDSAGSVRQTTAELVSEFAITAFGSIRHIDTSIIWYIPSDTTTWIIEPETTGWIIESENRTYKIGKD